MFPISKRNLLNSFHFISFSLLKNIFQVIFNANKRREQLDWKFSLIAAKKAIDVLLKFIYSIEINYSIQFTLVLITYNSSFSVVFSCFSAICLAKFSVLFKFCAIYFCERKKLLLQQFELYLQLIFFLW